MTQGAALAGIGHNRGPEMSGLAWRSHCWRAARAQLLPTLPIEVVRMRVRRAAELGLPYKSYAGLRASTGHDLVAFLFSSNALHAFRQTQALPAERAAKLAQIRGAGRIGLATAPLTPERLADLAPALTATHPAPAHLGNFAEARRRLRAAIGTLPSDAVVLIAEPGLEMEWCAAGRLAGVLPSEQFFSTSA
jgi:hypothetical protein